MTSVDPRSFLDDAWRTALEARTPGGGSDAMRQLFEQRSAQLRQEFESAARGGVAPTGAGERATAPASGGEALRAVDAELKGAESIPEDLLAGRIETPHELAARIRRADLTLKFSLEIRNRLIDAYREVMRMSV